MLTLENEGVDGKGASDVELLDLVARYQGQAAALESAAHIQLARAAVKIVR
jgi:hypothetical protein